MNGMSQNLTNTFCAPYVAFTSGHSKNIFVLQRNTDVNKRFFLDRVILRMEFLA